MCSSHRDGAFPRRVSPFGYLRFIACLRLPVAFRSLPRPSSALGARASTLCSLSLDYLLPAQVAVISLSLRLCPPGCVAFARRSAATPSLRLLARWPNSRRIGTCHPLSRVACRVLTFSDKCVPYYPETNYFILRHLRQSSMISHLQLALLTFVLSFIVPADTLGQ